MTLLRMAAPPSERWTMTSWQHNVPEPRGFDIGRQAGYAGPVAEAQALVKRRPTSSGTRSRQVSRTDVSAV